MKKYEFNNLIDVNTGKPPILCGCGCTKCLQKHKRFVEMGKQAAASFNKLMSTDDSHAFDNDVDYLTA